MYDLIPWSANNSRPIGFGQRDGKVFCDRANSSERMYYSYLCKSSVWYADSWLGMPYLDRSADFMDSVKSFVRYKNRISFCLSINSCVP